MTGSKCSASVAFDVGGRPFPLRCSREHGHGGAHDARLLWWTEHEDLAPSGPTSPSLPSTEATPKPTGPKLVRFRKPRQPV